MDIAELRLRIRSDEVLTADQALDRMTAAAGRAETATDQLANSSRRAGVAVQGVNRAFSGNRAAIQNASFQIQDLVTQLSMGTSATVALGQQVPQLLGSFGALGAVAGALAAVAFPAIGIAMAAAGAQTQAFSDLLDETEGALRRLRDANEEARLSVANLVAEYGNATPALRETLDILAAIAAADATASVISLTEAFRNSVEELGGWTQTTNTVIASLLNVQNQGRATAQEVQAFQAALNNLEAATTLDEAGNAARILRDQIIGAAGGAENLNAEQRELVSQLSQIVLQSARVKTETEGAASAAAVLTDRMRAAYGVYASTRMEAEAMASATAAAANAASLAYGRIQNSDGSGPDAARRQVQANQPNPFGRLAGGAGGVRRVAAGGGGGSGSPFASDLDQLVESLRTEQQIADEWYAEAQTILADRRALEILGEQAHREALLAVEQEYQTRLSALQVGGGDQRLAEAAGFFGQLSSIAEAGGERMAKAAATFAAVEGTINAYRAALQALADPRVGFFGKAAAYASVLAAGLQGVAAIRQAGGIGGGGRGPGRAAQTRVAAQNPQTVLIQGLRADELYSGSQIFDLLYQENNNRGRVFQVIR